MTIQLLKKPPFEDIQEVFNIFVVAAFVETVVPSPLQGEG